MNALSSRKFDELVVRLCGLRVIDREDLVLMHNLPVRERIPYLHAREQAFRERREHLKRSVEGWT